VSTQTKQRLMMFSTALAIVASIGGLVYSAGWQGHQVQSTAKRVDRLEERTEARFEEILRALGRIEGAIGEKDK